MTTNIFLLVLTASLLHALWNFLVRKTSGNLVILWIGIWIACIFILPGVIIRSIQTSQPEASLGLAVACTLATGTIHAAYFFLLGKAYHLGEISLVYPVARGSGVALTALMAWLVLQESFTALGIGGIVLICVGILSLSGSAKPSARNMQPILLALAIGVSIVAYSIVDKIGVSVVDPVLYIWFMFLISALLLTPYIMIRHRGRIMPEIKGNMKYAIVIGIGSVSTYLMILFAFRQGPVGYIVAIREIAVVGGAFLGIVLLKEKVTLLKLAAIALIVVGTVFIRINQ